MQSKVQQVCVIHGGGAFNSYEEYLNDLQDAVINLEAQNKKGWKSVLGERLGSQFQVISPAMPCKQNAKYKEWVIWFKKHLPFLKEGVILVGHSLGGIFLTKYLSEQKIPVKIKATLLVAAPYNTEDKHPLADFLITKSLAGFEEQSGKIMLYHSIDDDVVPFANAQRYEKELTGATTRFFSDRGHFNEETFEELENDIRNISR